MRSIGKQNTKHRHTQKTRQNTKQPKLHKRFFVCALRNCALFGLWVLCFVRFSFPLLRSGVVRQKPRIYTRKVTKLFVNGSCWKATPQRVIVPYMKTNNLSCFCSLVPQDTNSLGESAGTN